MHNSTLRGLSVITILATIFALSCESENNNVVVQDRPIDYFPLRKGVFQLYDVHQVIYTLGVPEVEDFQIKTLLVDSIDRGDGTYAYVQHRYKRKSAEDGWEYEATWSVQADDRELVVNEGNTIYLKYRFPLTPGYSWNGNTYNNGPEDAYVFEDVKVNQDVCGETFHDCLIINQNDNEDFVVFLDQRKEIYSRQIGLINQDVKQLHYCTQTESGCLGQQIVEEGIEYTQTLFAHGIE